MLQSRNKSKIKTSENGIDESIDSSLTHNYRSKIVLPLSALNGLAHFTISGKSNGTVAFCEHVDFVLLITLNHSRLVSCLLYMCVLRQSEVWIYVCQNLLYVDLFASITVQIVILYCDCIVTVPITSIMDILEHLKCKSGE